MASSTLKNKAKAKVAVRKRRKEREDFIKSILNEISVPKPINGTNGKNGRDGRDGKDGRDAPTIDEILLKIPKQEFNGVTATEFEDMFKAALDKELPKLEDKFRPKVELIREEIPKDKLESFITKKELDKVLRRVEEAIVYHSGGGGNIEEKSSRRPPWIEYASGFSTAPTFLQTIATGDVYEYTYTNGTLYRLVPSGSAPDAFYKGFAGGVLSGLVAKKQIDI